MTHHNHVKRLQHESNSGVRLAVHHRHPASSVRTNSFEYRSPLPNDEAVRESVQNFTITASSSTKNSRPFQPAPQRARRGGGGQSRNRSWHPSVSLPRREINYDLAESFMDHSTNPLSSDLYKIKFKHTPKQWPNGRFISYKDKLDKLDGTITEINCTRIFPIARKLKKNVTSNSSTDRNGQLNEQQNTITSSLVLVDPATQELRKKEVDKQTNLYANLFGGAKIPRLSSVNNMKKTKPISNSSTSSTSISLLGQNTEVDNC